MLAKTVPRMRGSPATAIHNPRQIADGLDADAPLGAPHRRGWPVGDNRRSRRWSAVVTHSDMTAGLSAEAPARL